MDRLIAGKENTCLKSPMTVRQNWFSKLFSHNGKPFINSLGPRSWALFCIWVKQFCECKKTLLTCQTITVWASIIILRYCLFCSRVASNSLPSQTLASTIALVDARAIINIFTVQLYIFHELYIYFVLSVTLNKKLAKE